MGWGVGVGGWQLAVGSWWLAVGGWRLAVAGWVLGVRGGVGVGGKFLFPCCLDNSSFSVIIALSLWPYSDDSKP